MPIRKAAHEAGLAAFNAAIDIGFAQVEAGDYVELEFDRVADFVAGLRRRGAPHVTTR